MYNFLLFGDQRFWHTCELGVSGFDLRYPLQSSRCLISCSLKTISFTVLTKYWSYVGNISRCVFECQSVKYSQTEYLDFGAPNLAPSDRQDLENVFSY